MQFDTVNIGKATIVSQSEVYDFTYDIDVPVRLVVQACGREGEGIAKLLGISVGCRQFRAYGETTIDVHAYTRDEFAYPAMNRVGVSLEVVAAAALAEWLGQATDLSWEIGQEIDDALDIPFVEACTKPRWYTAPEDGEVEHDLYDLPSSRDDAPAKGVTFRNGEAVEAETTEQEKDKDFWF